MIMDDPHRHSTATRPPPDFRWVERCCNALVNVLEGFWHSFVRIFERRVEQHPVLRVVGRIVVYGLFACLALLWASACYVTFPVSPYGFWDLVGWIFIAGAFAVGGVFAAVSSYLGVASLAAILSLLLLLLLWFTLSLFYLSYTVFKAARTKATWVSPYRVVIVVSVICTVALATYVDGTWRFWDRPFELLPWLKIFFLSISAWAALFCWIARDKVMEARTPKLIINSLSPDERAVLLVCLSRDQRTIVLRLYDPVASSLRMKGLLEPARDGTLFEYPHTIPKHIWESLQSKKMSYCRLMMKD